MSPRKPAIWFPAAVAGGVLLTGIAARADDSPAAFGADSAPKSRVTLTRGELIGSEQVQRAFVSFGTNEFLIVVPNGLRMDNSKPDKYSFVPLDKSFYLSFRFVGSLDAVEGASQSEACRELLFRQHPGAKIVEESSLSVGGRSGPAFDLKWKPAGATEWLVRSVFISSPAGMLQFTMLADPQNSSEAQFAFNGLVSGFRSNERGKIEIIRYCPNS